jgi:hypothetical protein
MKLTTQQASQATGKSRSTIWRSAKSGKVSAERTAGGDFVIDVAELERVFGLRPTFCWGWVGSVALTGLGG